MSQEWLGFGILIGIGLAVLFIQRLQRKWSQEGKLKGYDPVTGGISLYDGAVHNTTATQATSALVSSPVVLLSGFIASILGLVFIVYFFSSFAWRDLAAGIGFFSLGLLSCMHHWLAYKKIPVPNRRIGWTYVALLIAGILLPIPMAIQNISEDYILVLLVFLVLTCVSTLFIRIRSRFW